ncbi:eukaryotic translation initiation factor eIF1a-like protein [Penicillium hispanicum]|uniref:eukaryotic translation initiation factor eIF1a-like protein n=1 Tax=Penicillium hispanicum TaxID=1080232 RepID=UPI002541232B|nr:eukaryotic translation initiation factor eIF1a-like protein [Penicillium hispanicum]KAJ5587348.1 eukaryotic translation initiation factor eIF1a-like protein [Penicillium hispanicum]
MGPPRRRVLATAQETLTPPDELAETQLMARAIKATGNNIYLIEFPDKTQMLVELPARFRSTIWIKRGSYVVVDTKTSDERDNKIGGEIVNIVRDEKAWRKAAFWPKEFVKQPVAAVESDDEEESRVGKMPSSDESDA